MFLSFDEPDGDRPLRLGLSLSFLRRPILAMPVSRLPSEHPKADVADRLLGRSRPCDHVPDVGAYDVETLHCFVSFV